MFVKNRVFDKLRSPKDVILVTWRAEVTNVLILIPDAACWELLVFMTLRTLCGLGTINVQCSSVGSSVCSERRVCVWFFSSRRASFSEQTQFEQIYLT